MNDKEMFNKNDYLKTPESFNARVENCVREQLEQEKGVISMNKYKRSKVRARQRLVKAAVAVLAICMVAGGGAWAARQYQLSKTIERDLGPNEVAVDEKIQIVEEKQTVSAELPEGLNEYFPELESELVKDEWVTIKEAYFDGSTLYIYGEATDYGEQLVQKGYVGADHIYINGKLQIGGMYAQNPNSILEFEDAKNTIFYSEMQLADMMLTEDFTVEILFFAYPEGEERMISNVSFDVEVEDTSNSIDTNRVELDGGYVDVHACSISDTTTYLKYSYYFSGDEAEERIKYLCHSFILLNDNLGNEADLALDSNSPNGIHMPFPAQTEDGSWYVTHEFYLKGISTEASELKIIPYFAGDPFDEIEDCKYEVRDLLDFGIFTIKVK